MKRKLAIWLAWRNFSEYYSHRLAASLADEYETTVTYHPLDWDEFDVVMPFFPQRSPGCDPRKVVKLLWEPHEFGWAGDAGTVLASCTSVYERIEDRYENVRQVRWGVDPKHFFPQPFPAGEKLRVGWCGQHENPRKRFVELERQMGSMPQIEFRPNVTEVRGGRQSGDYEMETMHEYYAGIHVYVCASASEGFCFPLLEAAACGRAIITSDVGCARDLLESGAGVVVVDGWDEMRRAIKAVNWRAFGAMSAAAVARAWTWDKVKDGWLEALDTVGN